MALVCKLQFTVNSSNCFPAFYFYFSKTHSCFSFDSLSKCCTNFYFMQINNLSWHVTPNPLLKAAWIESCQFLCQQNWSFFTKQKKDNKELCWTPALLKSVLYVFNYSYIYNYIYNLLLIFMSYWRQIKRPVDNEKWHCHPAQCTLEQWTHLEVIRHRGCCCIEHPAVIFVQLWYYALSFYWDL